jgi:putative DNA primase/helicase
LGKTLLNFHDSTGLDENEIRRCISGAETVDSPDPEPLPAGLPPVPRFDEWLLPDALRPWIFDIADRAQAPVDFPAAGAIVALSSSVGRRMGIHPKRHDDWLVIPNLWGMFVGPPAFLKSPMLHEVLKPLTRLEAQAREEYERERIAFDLTEEAIETERRRLKGEATKIRSRMDRGQLIEQLRKLDAELTPTTRRRYVVNDTTVEKLGEILNENPSGVLLARDELAGFLAVMERAGHENDRAFYLESWNGYAGYTYDRIGRGTLHIKAACVSILGAMTPGPLGSYLRETFNGVQDDGLIQRFQLSVYPDPPTHWRNVDRWPDKAAKDRAFELFERFLGFVGNPQASEIPSLRFEDEAQDFFDEWRADLEARIRNSDEHPVIIAHLSKYRSLMPSLALIFHRCDCETFNPVTLEAAKRAAAWCDYLAAHARRIYHCVTARIDTVARQLGEKIRARKLPSPFTARDVYRHDWTGLTERDDVTRALDVLQGLNWLEGDMPTSMPGGGRPTMRYHVNPKVWPQARA